MNKLIVHLIDQNVEKIVNFDWQAFDTISAISTLMWMVGSTNLFALLFYVLNVWPLNSFAPWQHRTFLLIQIIPVVCFLYLSIVLIRCVSKKPALPTHNQLMKRKQITKIKLSPKHHNQITHNLLIELAFLLQLILLLMTSTRIKVDFHRYYKENNIYGNFLF